MTDRESTERLLAADPTEEWVADEWAHRASADSDNGLDALAEAVSDSLAATTEGTDYAEAPEPSDEPGSPYVMRLTNELAARGVARLSTPETSDD